MVLLQVTHDEAAHGGAVEAGERGAVEARERGAVEARQRGAAEGTPGGATGTVGSSAGVAAPRTPSPAAASQSPPPPATTALTVGARVRAARESRGWEIEEVVRRTALSGRVVRGIESDDFSACHGDCYARGHLRILARALSLDEAMLLAAVPMSDPLDGPDTAGAHDGRARPSVAAIVLGLALVAAVVALVLTQVLVG